MQSIIATLILGTIAAGCGGSSTSSADPAGAESETSEVAADGSTDGDSETAGIERSELSEREQLVLDMLVDAASERPEVWEGFSLSDLPTVIPLVEDNVMTSGFAMFHPNPSAAGEAVPVLDVDGVAELFYLPEVVDVAMPEKFSFDIDADVGGVETYVFPADFELIDLTGPGIWSSVFVHESFHVFQIGSWTEDELIDQQIYDLDQRNYELALLEDQALIAAWEGSGDDTTQAIRHFLALRATRLGEFPTTVLDGKQEIIEGAAEWFEREHTGRSETDEPWNNPFSGNLADPAGFAAQSGPDFAGRAPLQRFYYTGATQFDLLDRLGVDWQPRIEQYDRPADLLAEVVPVDASEYEALVEEAQSMYDPDGELSAVAEMWLTAEPGGDFDVQIDSGPESFVDAPPAVIECLAGYGLTAEQLEADPDALTTEANQDCVLGYQQRVAQCLEDAGFDFAEEPEEISPEFLVCFE